MFTEQRDIYNCFFQIYHFKTEEIKNIMSTVFEVRGKKIRQNFSVSSLAALTLFEIKKKKIKKNIRRIKHIIYENSSKSSVFVFVPAYKYPEKQF